MSTDNHTAISTGAAANASTINGPLGELDAAMGDVSGLTTTATDLAAAVNELDADVSGLTTSVNDLETDVLNLQESAPVNLMWDPFNQYYDDIAGTGDNSWNDRTRWSNVGGTVSMDDSDASNPYGLPTLKGTSSTTRINRRIYLDETGLVPGDVVSAAVLANAASGSYFCRITFRDAGAVSLGTETGSTVALTGTTTRIFIEGATIPASTESIDVGLWYTSGTNAEKSIYAMWLNPGPLAAEYPSPSVCEAFHRSQINDALALDNLRNQVRLRPISTTAFRVDTYWPEDGYALQWRYEKNGTTDLWMHDDAVLVALPDGSTVTTLTNGDMGFVMNLLPNGASGAENTGNSHNNMVMIETLFEDGVGNSIDITEDAYYDEIVIINRGYIRHSETGSTNLAQFALVMRVSADGICREHVHLKFLVDDTTVNYLNAGQIILDTGIADYSIALPGPYGPQTFYGGADIKFDGATEGYCWDTATGYAARTVSPQAVLMAIRGDTLKLYPRAIDSTSPQSFGNGDFFYASWSLSIVKRADIGDMFVA